NNTAQALWFPAPGATRKAVIVLPQWNSRLPQYVRLCRWLNLAGISALRLSLPYHDARMPPELERADYAVSANIARTVDAGRQAVIDTRSCLDWLESQGYRRLGIVGTSLGSCYAFLTSAHDARLRVNVFNLYSFYFADVVWNGLSTRHIRQGMDGQIDLRQLQEAWKPITPQSYAERYTQQNKRSLFLSTAYDTTFLPEYSKPMIADFRRRGAQFEEVTLPCGHYTLGQAPFQLIAGYQICSFFGRWL
ncbi:MAG: dienelactone hydrolase family protein, partial [Bryobacteraceae bacterium]